MDLERIGSKAAEGHDDGGVTFTVVTVRLASASLSMRSLSQAVRGAYNYVEDSAKQVESMADTAAGLGVDPAVTSAHNDAASIMRGVLADAEDLANEAAEMGSDFRAARDDHEADYGPVHDAMVNKPGAKADRTYYSNR